MSRTKFPDLLHQFRTAPQLFLPLRRDPADRSVWAKVFSEIERRLAKDAERDERARRLLDRARRDPEKEVSHGRFKQATAAEILRRIDRAVPCLQGKRTFTWDDLEFLRCVIAPEAYRPPADEKPPPLEPTDARPGTEEYAEVIAQRLQMGFQPFHPDDRNMDDLPDDVGYVATDTGRTAPAPAFRNGQRTSDPTEVHLQGTGAPQTRQELLAIAGVETEEEFQNTGEQDHKTREKEEEERRKAREKGKRRRKVAV